jgi:hypothetical protein
VFSLFAILNIENAQVKYKKKRKENSHIEKSSFAGKILQIMNRINRRKEFFT